MGFFAAILYFDLIQIFLSRSLRYFDAIDICKVRPDWMESRIEGVLPSHSSTSWQVTHIEVFQPTEVELGLYQQSVRYDTIKVVSIVITPAIGQTAWNFTMSIQEVLWNLSHAYMTLTFNFQTDAFICE